MGIDILPAELPIESSQYFSEKLYPFIQQMVTQPANIPFDQLPTLLRHSTITDQGKLTEAHQGLQNLLKHNNAHGVQKKTVLLLGSGMVSAPLVEHLARRPDVNIVVGNLYHSPLILWLNALIASNVTEEAKALVSNYYNVESVPLDISNHQHLSHLVAKADVVVR